MIASKAESKLEDFVLERRRYNCKSMVRNLRYARPVYKCGNLDDADKGPVALELTTQPSRNSFGVRLIISSRAMPESASLISKEFRNPI